MTNTRCSAQEAQGGSGWIGSSRARGETDADGASWPDPRVFSIVFVAS